MTYLTLEVEIDHGKVTTKDSSKLPDKASGLLTILQPEISATPGMTPMEALDALQKHLRVDAGKAAEWTATVREGIRWATGARFSATSTRLSRKAQGCPLAGYLG
jgi:hypothetical protein